MSELATRVVFGGLIGCLMGVLTAHMGYGIETGEFWAAMALIVAARLL